MHGTAIKFGVQELNLLEYQPVEFSMNAVYPHRHHPSARSAALSIRSCTTVSSNALPGFAGQHFGVNRQIAMHICRKFNGELHRLVVCDSTELELCH
jgi:hypothetical protein